MRVFAFVIIFLGILVFYIGIKGSQHEVMAMLKGSGSNVVASGLAVNTSGGGTPSSNTNLINSGGPTNGAPSNGVTLL